MKVILLQDVPKVGKKYEVKNVTDGFGHNSLIPQGIAIVATSAALEKIELLRKQHEAEEKIRADLLMKNFSSLDGVQLELSAKVSDKGHLFSSIHKADVIKALKDQKHIEVPEASLILEKPIKEVGEHIIAVMVGDKTGSFTLNVKATK